MLAGGGRDTLRVGNHTTASPPFADDVVMVALSQDLQCGLDLFAAVAAMKIRRPPPPVQSHGSRLEHGGLSSLSWRRASTSVRGFFFSQVRERWSERLTGRSVQRLWSLYSSGVVKKELSWKVKVLIDSHIWSWALSSDGKNEQQKLVSSTGSQGASW